MINLTFRQLVVFRELMRSGSLANAARTLHRTQPAISIMLGNMEKELGFQLFERRNRRLIPKPEAYYMLEEVEVILDRLNLSVRTLQEVANLKRGQLKIACMPASTLLMSRLVGSFVQDKPDLKVALMMRSSKVIEEWIASQQYDVGLTETPEERESVHSKNFILNCLCAVPAEDVLAEQEVLTPADLAGKPLATLYPQHGSHQRTQQRFQEYAADFQVRFELQTFLPGLELVAQGLCYCICDPISALGYQYMHPAGTERVRFVRFEPVVVYPISLLTPAHRPVSAVCEVFLAEVTRFLRELEQRGLFDGYDESVI